MAFHFPPFAVNPYSKDQINAVYYRTVDLDILERDIQRMEALRTVAVPEDIIARLRSVLE